MTAGGVADPEPWPRPLSDRDRDQGCLALALMEHWPHWVKRRVENVELVGPATSRHRISIDFRLRDWFPSKGFPLGDDRFIYVPLTLLAKYPILNFDVRDESGTSALLVTRRKSAAIAAGALSAFAARIVKEAIDTDAGLTGNRPSLEARSDRDIRLPPPLERYFYALAHAEPDAGERGWPGAQTLKHEFVPPVPAGTALRPTTSWEWTHDAAGKWRADASELEWRHALAPDGRFFALLRDLADFFLVCVPVKDQEGTRRLLKLSYQQHIEIPQLRSTIALRRRFFSSPWFQKNYTGLKDALEGLPDNVDWQRRGFRPHAASERGQEGISWFAKAPQAVGWMPKPVFFDAPAASQGGTYHFEFEAPPGLQIRQASLTASPPNQEARRVTAMGAQSLRRVQLYLGDLPESSWGRVVIHLKVAPNTLVRGAWFATLISTALLFVYFWKLDTLTEQNSVGSTLAALLLVPGLMAGLLTRGEEHPITTDLLFGLRFLCGLAAACPAAGAVLLIAARQWDWLEGAWAIVLAFNSLLLFVLSITWLLAARRRPDGSMP